VQAEVLLGGQVAVERRVLEHEADVPADGVALAGDVEAVHAGGAGGGPGERAEHVDRRALAGAVGAEEAEDLAAGDGERHTADGLDLAVGLDERVDLDGGRGGGAHDGHSQHARAPCGKPPTRAYSSYGGEVRYEPLEVPDPPGDTTCNAGGRCAPGGGGEGGAFMVSTATR
jgi:hypothetical protein